MYQLSVIALIFGAFVLLCLGALLNYFLSNRNKIDYKSKYEEAEKEVSSAQKKLSKVDSKLKQTSENRDMWRQKSEEAESQLSMIQSKSDQEISTLREEVDGLKIKIQNLTNDLERTQRDKEKLQENHNKLKGKYSENNKENKDWTGKLDKAEKDKKEYKLQWARAHKQSKELAAQLETQTEQIHEYKEVKRELRRANAKNKKQGSDLTYWEQKHFDTHHALAALKVTHEAVSEKLTKISDLRDGDKVMMDNMRKQLEEYKKKYIDINHKYKEMTSNSVTTN